MWDEQSPHGCAFFVVCLQVSENVVGFYQAPYPRPSRPEHNTAPDTS